MNWLPFFDKLILYSKRLGRKSRDDKKKKFLVFGLLAALEVLSCIPFMMSNGELWQIRVLFVIPLLLLYNGQKGSSNKYYSQVGFLFILPFAFICDWNYKVLDVKL